MRRWSLFATLSLLACGGKDDDTGSPDPDTDVECAVDADNDGSCSDVDCDDNNDLVAPGKPDIPYNGRDEDCDGEDLNDFDGDGYIGERAGGDDCNDANPEINPGAPEVCYGDLDMNCDGYIPVDDCDQDGFVKRADCNDENDQIFPGAVEVPYDGVDQDCSYTSDFDVDADGDEVPWDSSWPKAEWPDEIIVWNKTEPGKFRYISKDDAKAYWFGLDCDDNDPTIGGNLKETWDGIDQNCDGVVDRLHERDITAFWSGNAGVTDAGFGGALALIPDFDGDDRPEVAVGDFYGLGVVGHVYIIPSNRPTGKGFEEAIVHLTDGSAAGFLLGQDVESLGDIDGDGLGDLAVGYPYRDPAGLDGGVFVFLGKDLQAGGEIDIVRRHARASVGWQTGFVVANVGDLDGDGLADMAASAGYFSQYDGGASDINLGIWSGATLKEGGNLGAPKVMALVAGSRPGSEIAGGVDLDGDGVVEVAIGEYGGALDEMTGAPQCLTGTGAVYVGAAGSLTGGRILSVNDLDKITGGPCFGFTLGLADDLDGDGYGELVVADPGATALDDSANGGQVYLIPGDALKDGLNGPTAASWSVRSRAGNTWLRVEDRFADHDGDGTEDLVVASPGILDGVTAKLEFIPPSGESFVAVFDQATVAAGGTVDTNVSSARFVHRSAGSGLGASWAAGDLNDDGQADIVLGAPTLGVGGVFMYHADLLAD